MTPAETTILIILGAVWVIAILVMIIYALRFEMKLLRSDMEWMETKLSGDVERLSSGMERMETKLSADIKCARDAGNRRIDTNVGQLERQVKQLERQVERLESKVNVWQHS